VVTQKPKPNQYEENIMSELEIKKGLVVSKNDVDEISNAALSSTTTALAHPRSTGFLGLFPSDEHKLSKEHHLKELGQGFQYRNDALKLAISTKLQSVEEMCNHVLVTGKGQIRRQRQEFFATERLALEQKLDSIIDIFNSDIEKRYGKLDSIKHPKLRELEESRLEKKVQSFHDMIDQLIGEFTNIISEGVKK